MLSGASQIIPQVDLFVIQKERNKTSMDDFFEIQKTKKIHHSPSESLRFVLLFFVSTS